MRLQSLAFQRLLYGDSPLPGVSQQLRVEAKCVLCSGTCRRDIKMSSQAAVPVETCRDPALRVYLSEA